MLCFSAVLRLALSQQAGLFLVKALISGWLNNKPFELNNDGWACPSCAAVQSLL
jgi:hypothetical protein